MACLNVPLQTRRIHLPLVIVSHLRNSFLYWVVFALCCQAFCSARLIAESSVRPNVVLIMTDDQGWGDVGVHGNEVVSTPVLDSLSRQSVRLERFYVSPVCAPTRAALLTGRYPERTGVAGVTGRLEVMRSDEVTIAEVLSSAGYRTGCFGKWHNGAQYPHHPLGQGFQTFFGFCGGHWNLYDNPVLEKDAMQLPTTGYITDLITDAAIEFIEREDERPFFCYVPFNAPHGPFQVDAELFEKYNDGTRDEKTAAVYAMVENIDTNVGRILDSLEDTRVSEQTIVLFLTDNGPNGKRYNGNMRGAKGSVHEGGCRVPCFIRYPEKLKPKDVRQIAAHIDLLPTLIDLTGVASPPTQPLDGKSLAKLLRDGEDESLADRVILTLRPNKLDLAAEPRAAARNQRFRLTMERGTTSLFDMEVDPSQKVDVSNEHPRQTKTLKELVNAYTREIVPSITAKRPVEIGHDGSREVFLPAVEGRSTGTIKFANGNGWAHDWMDGWSEPSDRIQFDLKCVTAGQYEVFLHAHCATPATIVSAKCDRSETNKELSVSKAERSQRPDLDSKSVPRWMLDFSAESIGMLSINDTDQLTTLTLSATSKRSFQIDFGGITLRRVSLPAKERFHLFVLAGQSNMAGRGSITEVDKIAHPRVLMLNQERQWVPAVAPVHFDKTVAGVGLGRTFAVEYAKAHPDVTVGLIPCAVGGSPISAWQPGGYHKSTKTHPYDDAVERIESVKNEGVVRGILWHQGESDSKEKLVEAYEENLLAVFRRLRKIVGNEVPILIGGLGNFPERPWSDARKKIDSIHRKIAEQTPLSSFVDSEGLKCKSDHVHFDSPSLKEFGRRYWSAFQEIKRE